MGYETPNIDRIAREGMMFTDYYAEQSCTAGRSSFITGQSTCAPGFQGRGARRRARPAEEDITIAEALKPLGYATGQFGKNHLGDRNEFLPTVHGFDEFFGNLYHLNAEEEPENPDYPKDPEFQERFGPRGVLKCDANEPRRSDRRSALRRTARDIEDTGPLTKKRMETIDDETATPRSTSSSGRRGPTTVLLLVNRTRMHLYTHARPRVQGRAASANMPTA